MKTLLRLMTGGWKRSPPPRPAFAFVLMDETFSALTGHGKSDFPHIGLPQVLAVVLRKCVASFFGFPHALHVPPTTSEHSLTTYLAGRVHPLDGA